MASKSASKTLRRRSQSTSLAKSSSLRRLAFPIVALIVIVGIVAIYFSKASDGTFYPNEFKGVDSSQVKAKSSGASFWRATGSSDQATSSAYVSTDWSAATDLPSQTMCVSFNVSSPTATISFSSSYQEYDANSQLAGQDLAPATTYAKGLGNACVIVPGQDAASNRYGANHRSTVWVQNGSVAVYKIFSKGTVAQPPAIGTQPVGVAGNWRLAFSDEFDGSSLDTNKWRPNWLAGSDATITKPVNSAEQSCYDPAQVEVAGGVLRLTAEERSCKANDGKTYPYASGLVEGANHYTFTHGYLESRIFIPGGSTPPPNWPAFWANGTGTWPTTGELDVMELLDGDLCYHFHSPSGGPGGCPSVANPTGWHVFGANWQPGSVTYYYDGKQVGRITSGITDSPMYLVANLGIAPKSGTPSVVVPSTMQVDYIRVWQ